MQEECWRERPAQSAALLLVAGLLVPCFNAFAGLTALHTYLAATAQSSYEICKGAQVIIPVAEENVLVAHAGQGRC